MSEIAAHPRQSFSPRDYIFQQGEKVIVDRGWTGIVVAQDGDEVSVGRVWCVPGSSVAIACSLPQPIHFHRLTRPRR